MFLRNKKINQIVKFVEHYVIFIILISKHKEEPKTLLKTADC